MSAENPLTPILVADDNPTDLFFLQRRLNTAGITNPVHHVEDGVEAREVLERVSAMALTEPGRPRLFFLDLKMPRMGGFEVLDWMRDHGLLEQLTVAVLSTSDEPSDIERAYRLGAHKFLVKYPRPADLAAVFALAASRTGADIYASSTGQPR